MPTKKTKEPAEQVFDSQMMLEYACSRDPAKTAYLDKFSALVKLFETEVWFKGWKAQNDKTGYRGLRHAKPGEPLKAKKKAKKSPPGGIAFSKTSSKESPLKHQAPS